MRSALAAGAALIEALLRLIGRLLGGLLLIAVLATFLVVLLRYLFSSGSIGLQESALWAHSAVFMLGAGYALIRDAHVRVDVLHRGFSARRKAWLELIGGGFFLLPVALFIVYSSLDYVAASWAIGERSREAGGLPGVYLLKTLIPLLGVLVALAGLARMLRAALLLSAPADPEVSA